MAKRPDKNNIHPPRLDPLVDKLLPELGRALARIPDAQRHTLLGHVAERISGLAIERATAGLDHLLELLARRLEGLTDDDIIALLSRLYDARNNVAMRLNAQHSEG